jgi:hypothetical protein
MHSLPHFTGSFVRLAATAAAAAAAATLSSGKVQPSPVRKANAVVVPGAHQGGVLLATRLAVPPCSDHVFDVGHQ